MPLLCAVGDPPATPFSDAAPPPPASPSSDPHRALPLPHSKKAQDARFKNRSKRKSDAVDGGAGKKKQKELSAYVAFVRLALARAPRWDVNDLTGACLSPSATGAYEQEVAEINKRVGLSDTGAGVRPVTK